MLGGYKSEDEEPGIYYMVLSLLNKALDQATAFIANKLQVLGGVPQAAAATSAPISTLGSQQLQQSQAFVTTGTTTTTTTTASTPRTITLRRYGQRKGGEKDEIPSSIEDLLALATEYWDIKAVSVRDEKGNRIRRINLIQPGQVELLTKEEEEEVQRTETQ